ncbi:MAG: DNA polymerase I [Spirochaetaceae bacterium]|nr:DNA polymerase I [Spirochaetaceae bacterium]
MKNNTIYILDSYGLIYRSYYAFISRPLVNEKGENVSAIYGFFSNFLSLLQKNEVNYVVAAFDSRTPTFRHEMYPEYKATRQKTPEDLHGQVPIIEEILTALGVTTIRQDGFEADDLIATVARQCKEAKRECRILSGDKDLMQLVDNTTFMMKSDKSGGWETIDSQGVISEWGVPPELMLDMLSLVGDKADNVPGISGVGEKTAKKLLDEYGTLDKILENASNISGSIGKKIQNGIEEAKFSRELIKLRNDINLGTSLDSYSFEVPDFVSATRLLYRYGVPAVAKRYMTTAKKYGIDISEIQILDTSSSSLDSSKTKSESSQKSTEKTSIFYPEENLPENVQLKKNDGKYSAITSEKDLENLINDILQNKSPDGKSYVAFDCETDGLNTMTAKLAGFSLCYQKGISYYIPLITSESSNSENLFEEAPAYISKNKAISLLEKLFFNPDVVVIMHNGKFDYEVLISNGLKENPTCTIYDTMIASWLLHPDRSSFSLEKLTEAKLFIETISFDSIVPKGKNFTDVPLETAVKYGSEDADFTWQLWQIFEEELKKNNLFSLFTDLEMPILPILAQMEMTGIHIEKSELAEYSKDLSSQIEKLQSEIYDLVGHEFNIASPKQLQEVLFIERGLETGKKTKTGYSTDTAVLEELAEKDPVPAKILEFRKLSKLLSTYVDALPSLTDKNGRIHTNFIQTGTATGRLSSRDPNLQNIPVRDENGRKIRKAFDAEKNKLLISADYSQIELVILAHLSKDKNLCNAFLSGNDVHKATAAMIFGVSPEEVQPEMRRTAKTINFGVIYGMSAFRLARELGISRTMAKSFIDSYFATYSGVQDFINSTIEQAEKEGFVETINGRRRYIKAINSANKTEKAAAERIAINTPIQGSAADIVKKAMIKVHAELSEKFPEAKLLLQVHDELIVECPENQAEEVAKIMKTSMESVTQLSVPLKVSVEIGKRWGEFH